MDHWFAKIFGPKRVEPPPKMDNVDELISKALDEGKSEDDPYILALYIAKDYYDNQYEIDLENLQCPI